VPQYRANLGGINGSGVYMPDTRPIVDIGSVIDAASRAFATNRQGVLTRAAYQHAAALQDQEQQLRQAQAANNGILPIDAARRLVATGGFEEEAPAPPSTSGSPPGVKVPPAFDSSIEGAPDAGQELTTGAAPPTSAPAAAKKPKYTMIDLNNGYAQIPELTPGYRANKLLETRLRAAQDLETQRGGNRLAVVDARGNIQLIRDENRQDFTTARDQAKQAFDLKKQAAALEAHTNVARIRASMATDPAAMKPMQRITMLGKLADTYVAAAGGDPDRAVEIAEGDPTLSTFGTTPKQLQSFIAGSVAKWQRGELDRNLRAQAQTGDTPDEARDRVDKTRGVVTGDKALTIETQDEYDHLRNDLHWSDEHIARRYVVPETIKRSR
jgi:hypothetical protein